MASFLLPSYILAEFNLGVYVGFLLGRLTILKFLYQKEITTGLILTSREVTIVFNCVKFLVV